MDSPPALPPKFGGRRSVMNRHFYASQSLQEVQTFEKDLEEKGFSATQVHLLANDEGEAWGMPLHNSSQFFSSHLILAGVKGALSGVLIACLIILAAYFTGWANGTAGWTPFAFLSLILVLFGAMEGSVIGYQLQDALFYKIREALIQNKHTFFVDSRQQQEPILSETLQLHPLVEDIRRGHPLPGWLPFWLRARDGESASHGSDKSKNG